MFRGLLTTEEVAWLARIHRRTVGQQVRAGRLPPPCHGAGTNAQRFRASAVAAALGLDRGEVEELLRGRAAEAAGG